MGPLAEGKKRIKLSIDSLVYEAFKMLCRTRGFGHPSIVTEEFMRACIENPSLILLIRKIVEADSA
ncbi:MAG: hypothetical protein QXR42_05595 [Candidatus Bathyarchaeia archaeon]